MRNTFLMAAVLTGLVGAGCATTSAQEQRQAQQSQAKAVQKSLDEGKPVARVPDAPTTKGTQAQ